MGCPLWLRWGQGSSLGSGLKVKGHVVGLESRVNFGDRVKGEGSRGWVGVKGQHWGQG